MDLFEVCGLQSQIALTRKTFKTGTLMTAKLVLNINIVYDLVEFYTSHRRTQELLQVNSIKADEKTEFRILKPRPVKNRRTPGRL